MRSQIRILIIFWFARSVDTSFGQISTRPDGGIPVVTVCEALNNLTRYNGKLIVVVGKFANTREGAWLSEECERKIVTNRHTWDSVIYARSQRDPVMAWPERFKWGEELLGTKLKAVQRRGPVVRGQRTVVVEEDGFGGPAGGDRGRRMA